MTSLNGQVFSSVSGIFKLDILLYCLECLMAHGGGVVAVSAEAVTNRVAIVLSSLESTGQHSKRYHLHSKKYVKLKTVFV